MDFAPKKQESQIVLDEDVATMMRLVKSHLCRAMDMSVDAEEAGIFNNIYTLPFDDMADNVKAFTYCSNITTRIGDRMWAIWEQDGITNRMQNFFRRVLDYKRSALDAKVLENPKEGFLNTAYIQSFLRDMLDDINSDNNELRQLLDTRYEELLSYVNKSPVDDADNIVIQLASENKKLDAELLKVERED